MPIRADTSARSNPNPCLPGEKTHDLTKGNLLEQKWSHSKGILLTGETSRWMSELLC